MVRNKDSSAIVAVTDIGRTRAFYTDALGLELLREDDSLLSFRTGNTILVVYRSDLAGTNRANAVVWGVREELEVIAATLRNKGVSFEHYPGMDYADGIHSSGDFKMVWFKDPDGNILHLNNL